MNELFREVEIKMKQAFERFQHELKQVRTGRASLAILDGVTVDYFGTPTPLNQMANMAVADATLITLQPWDATQISAIERSIQKANIGLTPSNDGKIIRLPIPPLTEERRKELARKAHEMAESGRNGIRQARRDGNDGLKKKEKDKEISQDDERRGQTEVQRLHDHYIAQINTSLETKEKDILTV